MAAQRKAAGSFVVTRTWPRAPAVSLRMAFDQGVSFEEAKSLIAEKRVGAVELNRNLSRQLSTWAKWPEFPGLPDWM